MHCMQLLKKRGAGKAAAAKKPEAEPGAPTDDIFKAWQLRLLRKHLRLLRLQCWIADKWHRLQAGPAQALWGGQGVQQRCPEAGAAVCGARQARRLAWSVAWHACARTIRQWPLAHQGEPNQALRR